MSLEQREMVHPRLDLRLERGVNLVSLPRQLIPRVLVRGVQFQHRLRDLPAQLVLPRLARQHLVAQRLRHLVVHAVQTLVQGVHLVHPLVVLLAHRLLEDELMLEVPRALSGGSLLPLRELLVLVANDVVVAGLGLFFLVGQRALQLEPRVIELRGELANHGSLPSVVELSHPIDRDVEAGLSLGTEPPLVLERLGERHHLKLRLVELLADVDELLRRVVHRLLSLDSRYVSLQDLSLGGILPARVRHLARDPRNLRAEQIESSGVGALLYADPLLDLIEGVPGGDGGHLRGGFHSHRLRPRLLHVALRRVEPPFQLRDEPVRARVLHLQVGHALLQRLRHAPRAARVLLPRRLRDCHAALHVSESAGVRSRGGLRGDEPVLELANVVRGAEAAWSRPAVRSGASVSSRLGRRGPRRGKIVDAQTHPVIPLGRRSRSAGRRADARQAHRVRDVHRRLETSSGVEPAERGSGSHAHARGRRGHRDLGWRGSGRGDVSRGRGHLAREEQARRLRPPFAASDSWGRRYVVRWSCAWRMGRKMRGQLVSTRLSEAPRGNPTEPSEGFGRHALGTTKLPGSPAICDGPAGNWRRPRSAGAAMDGS